MGILLELQALVNLLILSITGQYVTSKFQMCPNWPQDKSYTVQPTIDEKNPKMMPPPHKRHINSQNLTFFELQALLNRPIWSIIG